MQLDSASITTDSSGAKVSELRYKPFGEIRYSWTSTPVTTPCYSLTRFTYTGQYTHMDDPTTAGVTKGFGLMFYNARWYDPALGRFAQADTIVPAGVQGLDRYAYVNNSPMNFIDPSGHRSCSTRQANTGDETCWQNVWSDFRNEMQRELDEVTQREELPEIEFDKPQKDSTGKPITPVAPRSDREALAFMKFGKQAVNVFIDAITAGNPINSCNQFVAAMLGLKDVDGNGLIDQVDYADQNNNLIMRDVFTPDAEIVIFGNINSFTGLLHPNHSAVVVSLNAKSPLDTIIIQTNSLPSTYGIYYTTVSSNAYYNLGSIKAWYLTR
jgi:RHS repeat-associated protein